MRSNARNRGKLTRTMTTNHLSGDLEHGDLPPIGILKELAPNLRARLAAVGELETLQPETRLTIQGRSHHALSVLISGKLKVTCNAHGDVVELAELHPGHTVGEMSLIDPQKSSATVSVIDNPALLWTIDGDVFNQLAESDPELGCAVYRMLAREMCRRLRQNSDHMLNQADELRTHFLDIDY